MSVEINALIIIFFKSFDYLMGHVNCEYSKIAKLHRRMKTSERIMTNMVDIITYVICNYSKTKILTMFIGFIV